MFSSKTNRFALVMTLALTSMSWIACNKTSVAAGATDGKIPITSKSDDAKREFLEGRDLAERLLGQESLQHFDKAIALDPDFALAEWARANNSPTAKEFFEHEMKASVLADKVSDGEKYLILANEAGANGEVAKQKDYLEKLVAAYPNDERAHLNAANFYFGQQQYDQALTHYKKATEIAPNYSPAYNLLGYSYRQQGDYTSAELAFKKYVELIPNDPNPYDSYAELLLKMGRFDDSIAQYRKALSIDPHFVPSHFGISADLMYQGKPEDAVKELQTIADQARNDGETRTALFGMAVVATDKGGLDNAIQQIDREYAVAEKKNDLAAMAGDLQNKGNLLEAKQKYDDASQAFDRAVQITEASTLSQEIKDNTKLQHHFNLATLAIAKKDFASAKKHADEFQQGAAGSSNPALAKRVHELAGRIALGEKDFNKATVELEQSNLQDPGNLYRLSLAYQAKGDRAKAQEFAKRAAEFNSLPQLNYAFIRNKAQKLATDKKA